MEILYLKGLQTFLFFIYDHDWGL